MVRGVGKCLVDERGLGDVLLRCFCLDYANKTVADFKNVVGVIRRGLFPAAGLNLNALFENDVVSGAAEFPQQRVDDERADARFFEFRIVCNRSKVKIAEDSGTGYCLVLGWA